MSSNSRPLTTIFSYRLQRCLGRPVTSASIPNSARRVLTSVIAVAR